jgi:hypothetical protein
MAVEVAWTARDLPVTVTRAAEGAKRVAAFLQQGGSTSAEVLGRVKNLIGIEPTDTLLAVGSVPEGHGTPMSDLDLILITDRDPTMRPQAAAVIAGRRVVDVLVLRRTTATELLGRLREWNEQRRDLSLPAEFDLSERTRLHRLTCGVRLAGRRLENKPSDRAALANLKLHVARHAARTVQVDLVGYRSVADYVSMCYATQDLLGHALDALLAGHGETNPTPKWRNRFLDRLPTDWESELPARPSGSSASALAWELHRLPVSPEPGLSMAQALRVTAFARRVFLWAEWKLLRGGTVALGPVQSPPGASSSPALPSLDLDVDFAGTNGRWRLGRLNAFGQTLDVDDEGMAIALQCDGISRLDEATSAPGSSGERSGRVPAFLTSLREAGLLWVPTPPDQIASRPPAHLDSRVAAGIRGSRPPRREPRTD